MALAVSNVKVICMFPRTSRKDEVALLSESSTAGLLPRPVDTVGQRGTACSGLWKFLSPDRRPSAPSSFAVFVGFHVCLCSAGSSCLFPSSSLPPPYSFPCKPPLPASISFDLILIFDLILVFDLVLVFFDLVLVIFVVRIFIFLCCLNVSWVTL